MCARALHGHCLRSRGDHGVGWLAAVHIVSARSVAFCVVGALPKRHCASAASMIHASTRYVVVCNSSRTGKVQHHVLQFRIGHIVQQQAFPR